MSRHRFAILSVVLACFMSLSVFATERHPYGILLLAHGGQARWNDSVTELARGIDDDVPTEVAFGMAQRGALQSAIERLQARNVERIIAVPLFVSSHSSVITSTEFLLGQRQTAPPEVELFSKMSHGHGHGGGHDHGAAPDPDATKPVRAKVPITMTRALNDHPIVAEILTTRVDSLSRDPKNEVVIVVAHGPVVDEENAKWLADMSAIVKIMAARRGFHRVDYLTVRDDAPEPIRSAAAAELRATVTRATGEGKRVIVAPLLIAYGGIEQGIHKRLQGLTYEMPTEGLLPDARLGDWVRSMAAAAAGDAPAKDAKAPAAN